MTRLKVGDKVKFVGGDRGKELIEGKVYEITSTDGFWFRVMTELGRENGWVESSWELVQPTGPVVTETVTKTRIVPGTYSGVDVGGVVDIPDCENPDRDPAREVYVCLSGYVSSDQLDAAAAVLSALAKGLRDA